MAHGDTSNCVRSNEKGRLILLHRDETGAESCSNARPPAYSKTELSRSCLWAPSPRESAFLEDVSVPPKIQPTAKSRRNYPEPTP